MPTVDLDPGVRPAPPAAQDSPGDSPPPRNADLPRPRMPALTPAQLIRRFGTSACRLAHRVVDPLAGGRAARATTTDGQAESALACGRRQYVEDLVAIVRRELPGLSSRSQFSRALAKAHAQCLGKLPRPPLDILSPYRDLDALAARLKPLCERSATLRQSRQALDIARTVADALPREMPWGPLRDHLRALLASAEQALKKAHRALEMEHHALVDARLSNIRGTLGLCDYHVQAVGLPRSSVSALLPPSPGDAEGALPRLPASIPFNRQHAIALKLWVAERQWAGLAALAEPDRQRMDELAQRIDRLREQPLPPRRSPPPSLSDRPPPRRAPLARAEDSDL